MKMRSLTEMEKKNRIEVQIPNKIESNQLIEKIHLKIINLFILRIENKHP